MVVLFDTVRRYVGSEMKGFVTYQDYDKSFARTLFCSTHEAKIATFRRKTKNQYLNTYTNKTSLGRDPPTD